METIHYFLHIAEIQMFNSLKDKNSETSSLKLKTFKEILVLFFFNFKPRAEFYRVFVV